MTEEIDERRARALCKLKCSLFACTQGKCLYWQDWLDGAKAIREADKAAINEQKAIVERLRDYGRRPHVICKEAADRIEALEEHISQLIKDEDETEGLLQEARQQRDRYEAALRRIANVKLYGVTEIAEEALNEGEG